MNNIDLIAEVTAHYLLIGSLIAAGLAVLAWVIIKVARIEGPVYRYQVWLFCLIGIAVLPWIWIYGPKLTLAVLPERAGPVEVLSPVNMDLAVDDLMLGKLGGGNHGVCDGGYRNANYK